MNRIRGLELLFNLEKKNFKSREDCVVAAFHCLLINEGLQCVGIGDEWVNSEDDTSTELLPNDWNKSQDVYSLRYTSKDKKTHFLLKIAKVDHLLLVNVVKNEDIIAEISVPGEKYVSEDYSEYSKAYRNLESLSESFRKEIMEKFDSKVNNPETSQRKKKDTEKPTAPSPLARPPPEYQQDLRDPYRFPFPQVGAQDLDPFAVGGGGMLMDPSGFGIPGRPSMPHFGIGGRGGLPRGAVPPGARFDPFMPPIAPGRFNPDPDHARPPDDYYL